MFKRPSGRPLKYFAVQVEAGTVAWAIQTFPPFVISDFTSLVRTGNCVYRDGFLVYPHQKNGFPGIERVESYAIADFLTAANLLECISHTNSNPGRGLFRIILGQVGLQWFFLSILRHVLLGLWHTQRQLKLRFFSAMAPWHAPFSHLAKSAVSGRAQYSNIQ